MQQSVKHMAAQGQRHAAIHTTSVSHTALQRPCACPSHTIPTPLTPMQPITTRSTCQAWRSTTMAGSTHGIQPHGIQHLWNPPASRLPLQQAHRQLQRHVLCRVIPERGEEEEMEGPLEGAGHAISRWWGSLTAQQRIYSIAAAAALLVLIPKLFLLFVVGLERMFVGFLIGVEEAVVQLIFKTTALGLAFGLVLLAFAGVAVFLVPLVPQKKEE